MKYGTYISTKDGLEYKPEPTIKATIDGKKIIVKPDNTLYWTVRSFGDYVLLK